VRLGRDEEHVVEGEALAADLPIELQQPLDVVGVQLGCYVLRQEEQGNTRSGRDFFNALTPRRYRPRVRVLLATAGLFVLAGSALAGRPSAHTLRKIRSGPIVAVTQDRNLAAWFTYAYSTGGCNQVHVLLPGKRDRTSPRPCAPSSTSNWTLSDGQPQLAIAAHMSMALWTLHETGGQSSFDQVVAASFGGPERLVERLQHASDGTGDWLGGVAGSGRTLAYSWDDVEYVDPVGCLSGGSCKQKIADGGIKLVARIGGSPTPLPGAKPALQLAASAGRIAYIPAVAAKSGRPSPNTKNSLYVVDAPSGDLDAQVFVRGIPIAIALSPDVFAVLTTQSGPRDRISWFSPADGTKLGSVLVSTAAAPQLAANNRVIVYRVGRMLHEVSTRNGHITTLAKTALDAVGLSLSRHRLVWGVNDADTGRLRAISVG
jgi:hypothetical protein